jgi:hypothetical protein
MHVKRAVPRVLVFEDEPFWGTRLSRIVEEAGAEPIVSRRGSTLADTLDAIPPPLSLIIAPLYPDPDETLDEIAACARRHSWVGRVPVLGISLRGEAELDLWKLRALGLVGLIDRSAIPEHVRFRVGQIVYAGREGRRYERAPCCLPVDVELNGSVTTEYAVSLSVGGMELAVQRAVEPDDAMNLRFSVPAEKEQLIETECRVIHVRRSPRIGTEFQVGVFFCSLTGEHTRAISEAVTRLRAAWTAVSEIESLWPGARAGNEG